MTRWVRCGCCRRWIKESDKNRAGEAVHCDKCFDTFWELSKLFEKPAYTGRA